MSTVSLPFTLPVKVQAQETSISFTQNDEGYFMNLDLKLEFPLQDLVDSLILCGDKVRAEISQISAESQPAIQAAINASIARATSPDHLSGSESVSTTCDPVRLATDMYGSSPFPRFDSPYRQKGKWQTNQATYFLKPADTPSQVVAPPPMTRMSANAPVFTPLSHNIPNPSPFSQGMASALSDHDVWELPGLPSPLLEHQPSPEMPPLPHQTSIVHSILQRGLSSVVAGGNTPTNQNCRQM